MKECVTHHICDCLQRKLENLEKELDDWKDEYQNLCKFANDYEERLGIAVEALKLNRKWFDEIYPDDIFIGGPNSDEGTNLVVELRTVNREAIERIGK